MNANYRGSMKKPINLKRLAVTVGKYHTCPHQLVIKDVDETVIFFSSAKFRVMECVNLLDASFLAFKYADLIDTDDVPDIYSQSYTSVIKLGYEINLNKLAESGSSSDTRYFSELFTALRVTKYNPVSVNVFSTGSVVACGLKEPEHIYAILDDLKLLINSCTM